MNTKTFGYIRVSTKEQNIERQKHEMIKLGIPERDIFVDMKTGKDFARPQYQLLKSYLRQGDLLYIHSIDRLGRNYKQIQEEWQELTKTIGVDIRVIDMPMLDTTQYKDLMGSFVSDLFLQILAFVAEKELSNIKERQRQGIARAKEQGKHLGRPRLNWEALTDQQRQAIQELYPAWKKGKITAVKLMQQVDLKKSTFYKIMKQYKKLLEKQGVNA